MYYFLHLTVFLDITKLQSSVVCIVALFVVNVCRWALLSIECVNAVDIIVVCFSTNFWLFDCSVLWTLACTEQHFVQLYTCIIHKTEAEQF